MARMRGGRSWLAIVLLASCAHSEYRVLSTQPATAAPGATRPAADDGEIVMYGRGALDLVKPSGCQVLGEIEARSVGEKDFPYPPLREGARRLGGNALAEFVPVPSSARKNVWRAKVLACPVGEIEYWRGEILWHEVDQDAPGDDPRLVRAAAHIDRACAAGALRACRALGTMYRYGRGVPRDEVRALALYHQACPAYEEACFLASQLEDERRQRDAKAD